MWGALAVLRNCTPTSSAPFYGPNRPPYPQSGERKSALELNVARSQRARSYPCRSALSQAHGVAACGHVYFKLAYAPRPSPGELARAGLGLELLKPKFEPEFRSWLPCGDPATEDWMRPHGLAPQKHLPCG